MSAIRIDRPDILASASSRFAGTVGAPHLFEIVELPDVRPENMYNRVAGVEQDPVAKRHSLDSRSGEARIAAGLQHSVCDRSDVRARATGRNDHPVGQSRLTGKLDRHYAFGLRVFEAVNDDLGEKVDVRTVDERLAGRRRRIGMRRKCQRSVPLGAGPIRERLIENMMRAATLFKPVSCRQDNFADMGCAFYPRVGPVRFR
jgi:hypothetical protein